MCLSTVEDKQHRSRDWASVSVHFPLQPSPTDIYFASSFSSLELCIFCLPQACKEAAAAASKGLQCRLSTSHLPPERSQAAADQPRDHPLHPLLPTPDLGVVRVGRGHRTLTCVVGGRWQTLTVLFLDGGCNLPGPKEEHLHGVRAEHRQGEMCKVLLLQPPHPPWTW